jgi:para-nitrobenzyl esterase
VFAWTDDDYRVSETMQAYFANFIKTGNPNAAGLPAWPVGLIDSNGNVTHMRIDVQSRAEPEDRARFLFLDHFYAQSKN